MTAPEHPRAGDAGDGHPGPHVPGDVGHGTLGRFTAAVYWLIVVSVMLVVASLPTLVLLALLDRSWGNIPIAAIATIPVGPALSAGFYAMRERERSSELAPAGAFWRGYRQNWADVVRLWTPALVVLGIVGYVLANAGAAGVSGVYAVVLAVLAVVVLAWLLHAIAIASLFSFRTRDVARLAAFSLGTFPLVTLGVVGLAIVAGWIVWLGTEAALAVLGGVWVWFWYQGDKRMLDDVRRRFTTPTA